MRPGLFLTIALALAGTRAAAQSDVAVVLDTNGAIHGGFPLQSAFCRETAKRFLQANPDQFDGVVTFTTRSLSDLENVQQGTPVMLTAQGISTSPSFNFSASYGSNNKLAQCVFMGSLQKLPNNPDGPVQVFFGLPLGLTGVELVGHEYGHHWLLWLMYYKADGRGPQHLLRGYESGSPNGHYNYHADSHSVMYGNFITDHGNGSFTHRQPHATLRSDVAGMGGGTLRTSDPRPPTVRPGRCCCRRSRCVNRPRRRRRHPSQ